MLNPSEILNTHIFYGCLHAIHEICDITVILSSLYHVTPLYRAIFSSMVGKNFHHCFWGFSFLEILVSTLGTKGRNSSTPQTKTIIYTRNVQPPEFIETFMIMLRVVF